MAYPPSCGVLGRAKDVIGGFEWEQDVLTGLDGAERRRHLDAVPGHDDGLAFGEGAVLEAVGEDDWFHAALALQRPCPALGAWFRKVVGALLTEARRAAGGRRWEGGEERVCARSAFSAGGSELLCGATRPGDFVAAVGGVLRDARGSGEGDHLV